MGRAGDGQPGLRPRPRPSRLGAAPADGCRRWRNQQVLDIAHAGGLRVPAGAPRRAARRVRDRLPQVGPQPRPRRGGPAARRHARCRPRLYRLLDELRAAHPGLEIESCSSGGARVDLGILARTDRVWASDTNDALERQPIQRWTRLLLPPELIGSHVGPPRAHTTGRTHDLSFRVATALFGHFGIEWDIDAGDRRGPRRPGGGDRALQARAAAAAQRRRWCAPTTPTRPVRARRRAADGARRCSPTSSSRPRPRDTRRARLPGLDPDRATASTACRSPAARRTRMASRRAGSRMA